MQSKATTVEQYLAELPEDRRRVIQAVREVILKNLDKDYEEGMQYGMISYYVPHRIYPEGYHCDPKQPLPFAALASQKNYMSVYLMPVADGSSADKEFRAAWAKTGKKLDMGKCCIRFKKLEDLPLNVLGDTIRRTPVLSWIKFYESAIKNRPARTKSSTTSSSTRASARTGGKSITAKTAKPARKKTSKKAR